MKETKDFPRYGGKHQAKEILRQGGTVVRNSLEDDLIIFKSGLRIILEHGWIQGRGGNLEEGVCVRAALNAATRERYLDDTGDGSYSHTYHPLTWAFVTACIEPYENIPDWNDAPGRTEGEVVILYRSTIRFIEASLEIKNDQQQQEEAREKVTV